MEYINPLFNNNEHAIERNAPTPQAVRKKKEPIRAVRKDKTHNIKFPVSPLMQIKLRSHCKQAGRICRMQGRDPISQTKFNTALLRFGLRNEEVLSWDEPYGDSKVYMHTNLLETEYVEIGGPHGIAIRKQLSERKAVYHIILSVVKWLEGGGNLEEIL